ncbi:ATP-binding protein, partial [Tolypothrix sp. VBCCA 56010]|uniref:ATP-binding protein n=1 Tax=Tolypothrix sp. VBCCA 56010 TaxID=3137731 RepID=UPI003D7C8266
LKEIGEFLQTPVEIEQFKFSLPIGEITAKTKNSQQLRSRLRQYMEPQTTKILNLLNEEILKVATQQLKQHGQKGLVVIVDNLDRIENKIPSFSNESLPKYIFVDRGEQLKQINCHVIYTLPLSLTFSNEQQMLRLRLGGGTSPIVLPMVPVQLRNGRTHSDGIDLLRQMVLARAFPDVPSKEQLAFVTEVFDSLETLDRLCCISGGHVRNLLGMLYGCLMEEDPPISYRVLERAIQTERDSLLLAIDNSEWDLLFEVAKEPKEPNVKGDLEFQTLLRSLFVFEYQDEQGKWFGLNPLLIETEKYKLWKQQNS